MTEPRWIIRNGEKVLQYRKTTEVCGVHAPLEEWQDVPVVEEEEHRNSCCSKWNIGGAMKKFPEFKGLALPNRDADIIEIKYCPECGRELG